MLDDTKLAISLRKFYQQKLNGLEGDELVSKTRLLTSEVETQEPMLRILRTVLEDGDDSETSERLSDVNEQVDSLEKRVSEAQEQLEQANVALGSARTELDSAVTEKTRISNEVGPYRESISIVDTAITTLNGELLDYKIVSDRVGPFYTSEFIDRLVVGGVLIKLDDKISEVSLDSHSEFMKDKRIYELMQNENFSTIAAKVNSKRHDPIALGDIKIQVYRAAAEKLGDSDIFVVSKTDEELAGELGKGMWLTSHEVRALGSKKSVQSIGRLITRDVYMKKTVDGDAVGYVSIRNCGDLGLSSAQLGFKTVAGSGESGAQSLSDGDDGIKTIVLHGEVNPIEFDPNELYDKEFVARIFERINSGVFGSNAIDGIFKEHGEEGLIEGPKLIELVEKYNGVKNLGSTSVRKDLEGRLNMEYNQAIALEDRAGARELIMEIPGTTTQVVRLSQYEEFISRILNNMSVEGVGSIFEIEKEYCPRFLREKEDKENIMGNLLPYLYEVGALDRSSADALGSSFEKLLGELGENYLIDLDVLADKFGLERDELKSNQIRMLVAKDAVIDIGKKLGIEPETVYAAVKDKIMLIYNFLGNPGLAGDHPGIII